VVYESPYAGLPSGYDVEEPALVSAATAAANNALLGRRPNSGTRSKLTVASHPPASDLAGRDKATATAMKKVHTQLALGASRKTFSRTATRQ
jgi:hypothetical protein